jgi:flagellar biosynthesis/type III secretory pathway M-ring protein FliF/YscJ
MKKLLAFIAFFVLSMLMCMATAMAYIDPSAMTYIIQIVAGVVIAAGAALGFYWRRIKRALTKRKNKDEDDEYEDDDEEEDADDE